MSAYRDEIRRRDERIETLQKLLEGKQRIIAAKIQYEIKQDELIKALEEQIEKMKAKK